MSRLIEMTGRKFGMLMVLGRAARAGAGTDAWWLCRCECGQTVAACGSQLRRSVKTSCGCSRFKHGQANQTPEYHAWEGMKQRCLNPSNAGYERYGGRGITVCDRWMEFGNFYVDMGSRPGPEYSIDRINVYGNYEPGNCRWATPLEQQRNTRQAVRQRAASELLLRGGYWPQRPDFSRACMRGDADARRIVWWRAASFATVARAAPEEQKAVLDFAVMLATDSHGLTELDGPHRREVVRAIAAAAGVEVPDGR